MYRSKFNLSLIVLALALSSRVSATPAKEMFLVFEGKGTVVGWDFGFARALYEKLDPKLFEAPVIGGTSSGVVPSAYFACHGFSPQSFAYQERTLANFSRNILDENVFTKLLKLFLRMPTEVPVTQMDKLIDAVTDNKTCVPKHPLVITAANVEVIDSRDTKPKKINYENMDVSLDGKVLGKACTYFMTVDLVKQFANVKKEDLLCDIRPIETSADLYLAMVAGFSEPTYFPFKLEPHPEKIISAYPVGKRLYGGSFPLLTLGQDFKKLNPALWTIGTGKAFQPRLQDRIMMNWYTVSMNLVNIRGMYYLDLDMIIPEAEYDHVGLQEIPEQAKWGYQGFMHCLTDRNCVVTDVVKPKSTLDFYGNDLGKLVQRGIAPLLP